MLVHDSRRLMTAWYRSRSDARSFFVELHGLQRRWDPLSHPFYERMSDGTLTGPELAHFTTEYEHVIIAEAAASRAAAEIAPPDMKVDLTACARDAAAGIEYWQRFRDAVGGLATAAPSEATVRCARAWRGPASRSPETALVLLYAITSSAVRVALGTRDALAWVNSVTDGPATVYFYLHADRQRGHARRAREHLESRIDHANQTDLLACLDAALASRWQLLSALDGDHAGLLSTPKQ